MASAWGLSNAVLRGFDVHPLGAAQAAAAAEGARAALAWLDTEAAAIRLRLLDDLGPPGTGPGVLELTDGTGLPVSGPAIGGWGGGFAVAWSEQAGSGEPSAGTPALLRLRLVGSEGPLGPDIAAAPAGPGGLAVIRQHQAVIAPFAPAGGGPGFALAWAEEVQVAPGVIESRVMVQRFAVSPGGEPLPAGADGLPGAGGDAPVRIAAGADPHLARLSGGELVLAWTGADGQGRAVLVGADGRPLGGIDLGRLGAPLEGQGLRIVPLADGGFAILRVRAGPGDGAPLLVSTAWTRDAPGAWTRGEDRVLATLPPDLQGQVQAAGGEDGGAALWTTATGQVFLRAFDGEGVPLPEGPLPSPLAGAAAVGEPGNLQSGGVLAVLPGQRFLAAWEEPGAGGALRAQILDARAPAQAIPGGDGPDRLIGTVGDDTIEAGAGADTVIAGLGDDLVLGGNGNDRLDGGTARVGDPPGAPTDHDILATGGPARSFSITTNGDGSFTVRDMRPGSPRGEDTVLGFEEVAFAIGAGPVPMALFHAPAQPREVRRGPDGGSGADLLRGGDGADALDGGRGNDTLVGLAGDDLLIGGTGDDAISGNRGADTLIGGAGDDLLRGLAGDDLLVGGFGADQLFGSDGIDTVSYRGEFARFHILLWRETLSDRDPATGALLPDFRREDLLRGIENAIGGEAADFIRGTAGANRLEGGGGDDTLQGGAGFDTAVFAAPLAEHALRGGATALRVAHLGGAGAGGTDRLSGIERLEFGPLSAGVAENAAGARIATLVATGPGPLVPALAADDARFEVVAEPGALALRLRDGVALDAEAEPLVTVTLRGALPTGVEVVQQVRIAVGDVAEPVRFEPGGDTAARLVEDSASRLEAQGGFAYLDPEGREPLALSVTRLGVASTDPAVPARPVGELAAQLNPDGGTGGGGRVDWRFRASNEAVQHLGEGDLLTQRFAIALLRGDEFAIAGAEGFPSGQVMAALADGGFVVAWTGIGPDGFTSGIWVRIFEADGTARGEALRANTTLPALGAAEPAIVALDGGGFAVAWRGEDGVGAGGFSSFAIGLQAFAANGVRLGQEVWVHTPSAGDEEAPGLVALAGDRMLVTWQAMDPASGGFASHLAGRLIAIEDLRPVPLTGEIRLTPGTPPPGETLLPLVEARAGAALAEGGFVQAWIWTEHDSAFVAVLHQVFGADGTPLGPPVMANAEGGERFAAAPVSPLAVAALAGGGFVTAWQTVDPEQPLALRLFGADGAPAASFVFPAAGGHPADLRLLALDGGGFALAWFDADSLTVHGRAFGPDGTPLGPLFSTAPDAVVGPQAEPRLAQAGDGGFVLGWTAAAAGGGLDLLLQSFAPDGTPVGGPQPLSLTNRADQSGAELLSLAGGGLAASWLAAGAGDPELAGRVFPPGFPVVGAVQEVTITIEGRNDAPFAASFLANPNLPVEETGVGVPATLGVLGDLRIGGRIGDVDAGEAEMLRVVAAGGAGRPAEPLAFPGGKALVEGLYGTLSFEPTGVLRYELDNDRAATEALRGGEAVEEVFSYVVANGPGAGNRASGQITVEILGTNDRPTAAPVLAVLEGGATGVAGSLRGAIGDVDAGEAAALRVTHGAVGAAPLARLETSSGEAALRGTYGTLVLEEAGAWRYAIDLTDPDTLALVAGQAVEELFAYAVSNGSAPGDLSLPATLGITILVPEAWSPIA